MSNDGKTMESVVNADSTAVMGTEVKETPVVTDVVMHSTTSGISTVKEQVLGFDDVESEDLIVPRVKVVQALSPERKAKTAEEGEIINSLTGDKLNGKVFIPVFMFKSNIKWPAKRDDAIECMARLGKVGQDIEGNTLMCAQCKQNEWDNSKSGDDAIPLCAKYINFFGFFKGEQAPIILSFSKTNYNEGRTMISLAKSTMQNMFNYGYKLESREVTKGSNSWFIIVPSMDFPTSQEDRFLGRTLYDAFKDSMFKYDAGDTVTEEVAEPDGTRY